MKRILFVYPSMMLGGSTTALLSLMNSLDPAKYQIDLQLQSNSGPLLGDVPAHVNILPAAQKYTGAKGRVLKPLKFVLQGAAIKALLVNFKNEKRGLSPDVVADFFAKSLSRKNPNHYDYAIGFLEGWSNFYLAYHVDSDKKYAWLHSTFANITSNPQTQLPWMKRVDKIVFVTDACAEAFKKTLPVMADKTIVIENITDSRIIRKRSERREETDEAYIRYKKADCFKIITVCRLTISTKGLDRIVCCAKRLKEEGIAFLWYIVGNGTDEEQLKTMIDKAGVAEELVPIGVRFNPYPFIKEADVMCMPSRYEGKPIVVTESMILGVPPIVTEYLSAHDQIDHLNDGLVVPNDEESVVAAMLECSQNFDKILNMKECLQGKEYGNKAYISTIEDALF
jgi:glycosyltransferase involved in cell wall biosynthesis